jgi:hypothetical protein
MKNELKNDLNKRKTHLLSAVKFCWFEEKFYGFFNLFYFGTDFSECKISTKHILVNRKNVQPPILNTFRGVLEIRNSYICHKQ